MVKVCFFIELFCFAQVACVPNDVIVTMGTIHV